MHEWFFFRSRYYIEHTDKRFLSFVYNNSWIVKGINKNQYSNTVSKYAKLIFNYGQLLFLISLSFGKLRKDKI